MQHKVVICLFVLVSMLTPAAGAAEINLIADGLGLAQCFDPDATVPGGLTAGVVRNRRVYGPVDEFPGARLNTLTRGGSFNPNFRFNLLQAARLQLELEPPRDAGPANNRFEELVGLLRNDQILEPANLGLFRALTASSQRARASGDTATADALAARANALIAGTFDEPATTRELLAALAPPDRLRDLLDPNFLVCDPNTQDRVSHWAVGLASNILGLKSAPGGIGEHEAARSSVPFLVGRDGIRNNADDLPFFQPEKGMRIVPPGADAFNAFDFEDVVTGEVGGTDVEFYGRFKEDVLLFFGCGELGGTLSPGGECEEVAGDPTTVIPVEAVRTRGCKGLTGEFTAGGFNADGDCIQLDGIKADNRPFALLAVLGDLELRPQGAQLEPCDRTDLKLIAQGHGKGIPARPRSAGGTLTFPVTGAAFERRVDEFTGAPVRSTGARSCRYRTTSGGSSTSIADSVGPDGIAGNRDDVIASVGNCLLFDNPVGDEKQTLRESNSIALSHPANQTFFHALCTASFDPDRGFCAVDILNSPDNFSFLSNILAGGFIGGLVADGLRFIRTAAAPFDSVFTPDEIKNTMFQQIPRVDLSELAPEQKALLGCGPQYLLPCGAQDVKDFTNSNREPELDDPSIHDLLPGSTPEIIAGGMDLQYADGSVMTQEMLSVREQHEGALIGARTRTDGSQYFEAGISSGGLSAAQVIALDAAGRSAFEANNNERQLLNRDMSDLRGLAEQLFPGDVNGALTTNPIFADYDATFDESPDAGELRDGADALVPVATDSWIEPLPWLPDPDWLAQGILVYQVADQNQPDPRCRLSQEHPELFDPDNLVCFNASGERNIRTFNDPTDPTNPLNVFRSGSGESCIQGFGDTKGFLSGSRTRAYDSGCTDLETVVANLERLSIALGILGADRVPDPVESLEELWSILDGDPNTNLDPLAGPDGRFVANLATGLGNAVTPGRFEFGERETHVARNELRSPGIGIVPLRTFAEPGDNLALGNDEELARASENFMRNYDPTTCRIGQRCHLGIFEDNQLTQVEFNEVVNTGLSKELVTVIPVSIRVDALEFDDAGNVIGLGPSHVNLLKIYYQDPVAFASLLDPFFQDENGLPFVPVEIDGKIIGVSPFDRRLFLDNVNFVANCQDLDADGLCDWDHDDDGVYDGADDYTDGKSTDDGLFCGSGLPGDVLQEALQFEFARPSDWATFAVVFPNGLPPRSPVFCGRVQKLIGLTGESAPDRRDFVWHGAERADDPDADAWPDLLDSCPSFANANQDGDTDGDSLCDAEDPCMSFANTLPLVISNFSGIPDECLCGDFDGNGSLSATDAAAINRCAAFVSDACLPRRDEVAPPFNGFFSATDASLVNRVAAFVMPAYTLTCELRPEGTCGGLTGVSCEF